MHRDTKCKSSNLEVFFKRVNVSVDIFLNMLQLYSILNLITCTDLLLIVGKPKRVQWDF